MTEDEMVGWHHQLNGHEFEQTLGDSEGQGSLACYGPWVQKELYMTQQLNSKNTRLAQGENNSAIPLVSVTMSHSLSWNSCGAHTSSSVCTPSLPVVTDLPWTLPASPAETPLSVLTAAFSSQRSWLKRYCFPWFFQSAPFKDLRREPLM